MFKYVIVILEMIFFYFPHRRIETEKELLNYTIIIIKHIILIVAYFKNVNSYLHFAH